MAAEIVERVRNVKDDLELATLKKAVEISERAFEEVLPMLKPGAKERDVGAKVDYLFKLYGGDGPGYDSIIASGPPFFLGPRGGQRPLDARARTGRN